MIASKEIVISSPWKASSVNQPLLFLKDILWNVETSDEQDVFFCLKTKSTWSWGRFRQEVARCSRLARKKVPLGIRVVVCSEDHSQPTTVAAFLGCVLAGYDVILPIGTSDDVGTQIDGLSSYVIWESEFSDASGQRDSLDKEMDSQGLHFNSESQPVYWIQTSGSTGAPKWIEHSMQALVDMLVAHRDCGLLEPHKLGGVLLCPLFSHTMGIRSVLLALFAQSRVVFVSADDWDSRPLEVVAGLRKHPPEVIYSGPGLLRDIVQFVDFFPVLQREILPNIKTIVSSGASYDEHLAALFPNVSMVNAFGMSEAHALSNGLLVDQDQHRIDALLPGVQYCLKPDKDLNCYRLWVFSPYKGIRYVGQEPFDQWLDTGDCVVWSDEKGVRYVGRADDDFIQNGSGWKISRTELEERHRPFPPFVSHVEWVTTARNRSLSALIWIGDSDPKDPKIHSDVQEWFIRSHLHWQHEGVSNFVIQQMHCNCVGLLSGKPSKTKLGKVVLKSVDRVFMEQIDNPLVHNLQKVEIPSCYGESGIFAQVFPRRSLLLAALNLDWEYTDGKGDVLFGKRGLEQAQILDMVGGYGCNLLGHQPADLLKKIEDKEWGISICTQGSHQPTVARFCAELAYEVSKQTNRNYVVCPTTTGAEAVELALKHCVIQRHKRFERRQMTLKEQYASQCPELIRDILQRNQIIFEGRRPVVIALEKAFHGKSFATLSVLGDPEQRNVFSRVFSTRRHFLSVKGGVEAKKQLEELEREEILNLLEPEFRDGVWVAKHILVPDILAVLVEPILGEGGIWEVPSSWLRRLSAVEAPLILDEIQSGLGRSGAFLAAGEIPAEIILLGKSLGGGLSKISTALIDRAIYEPEFDDIRSTTYSEANRSARIALEVLKILRENNVTQRAGALGTRFKKRLLALKDEFPTVILDVRGRGLMLGVEIGYPNAPYTVALNALSKAGLGYLAASYLLNCHHIRCLPTTSAPNVLRIEPSIELNAEQIERVIQGFRAVAEALFYGNLFELSVHFIDEGSLEQKRQLAKMYMRRPKTKNEFLIRNEPPQKNAIRVGFVHDPVNIQKLLLADCPAFGLLSSTQRLKLLQRFELLLSFTPMPSFGKNLMQGSVWLRGYTMPILPQTIAYLCRRKEFSLVQGGLQKAVEQAEEDGCKIVVMGAQTSILSRNATTLLSKNPDTVLCSGNTFTTATIIHNIQKNIAFEKLQSIAVLGALGNIGSALVEYFAVYMPAFEGTIHLVGRAGSEERLKERCQNLLNKSNCSLSWGTDLYELRNHGLVIASISGQAALDERHFKSTDSCIVADISQPPALSADIKKHCPKIRFLEPAMVSLPFDGDFQMSAHSAPGEIFACAAEGIVTALAPHEHKLIGAVSARAVSELLESGIDLDLLSCV